MIRAIIHSIWNVFIKFRWHDEKLTKDANGEYDIVVGKIQLIVAIPPVEVSMKMGEKFITGPIKINLEEQKKASNISCVATGKVIIDKSRCEVYLLEEDTIENVS